MATYVSFPSPSNTPPSNLRLQQLPGLIHAWYIIAKYPEPTYEYEGPVDAEGGHIYVFVRDGRGGHRVQQQQPRPGNQGNMNYGTASNNNVGPASRIAAPPVPTPQKSSPAPHQHDNAEAGPSDGRPPPSYAQVVAGDHKIQTQD